MQNFEWDKNKRLYNIEKHGFDFIDVIEIFDDPNRIELETIRNGEKRFQTIGIVNDLVLFLVYTLRDRKKRIISVRRANKNERKAYGET